MPLCLCLSILTLGSIVNTNREGCRKDVFLPTKTQTLFVRLYSYQGCFIALTQLKNEIEKCVLSKLREIQLAIALAAVQGLIFTVFKRILQCLFEETWWPEPPDILNFQSNQYSVPASGFGPIV